MQKLNLKNISSLEKVFCLPKITAKAHNSASALQNEEFSYQIAFKTKEITNEETPLCIEIVSDIADYITVYNVKNVPVYLPRFNNNHDNCYLSDKAGLYPDILEPYEGHIRSNCAFYRTLWVSVKPDSNVKPGIHKIKIIFKNNDEIWGESVFSLEVIGALLPETDIPVTNWFHCDCIASFYGVKPLSEKHWALIENFISLYTSHGNNMLLTPVFTPALDTKVGSERPTVQLVDICLENGVYSFGFEKLLRWIKLCKKYGIKYLEICHLFSQWGAKHTPKIVVKQNGRAVKKFGWQTDALGNEYKEFLRAFLPALTKFLAQNWDKDKVYFHLSDEPSADHIDHYGEIYKFVKPLLGDFRLMDAISDFEIYSKGFIDTPVVATNKTAPFLENNCNIWAYYCCVQGCENYSNRFIAMPSFRNRIMGTQLYALNIKGFLHWGYNFYYSHLSTHKINPYLSSDADGAFPAGDAFSVYPGVNGGIPSLRFKVFHAGLQDLMAFRLLESKIGKDKVQKIINRNGEIDFNHYPMNSEYILETREKINREIKRHFTEQN